MFLAFYTNFKMWSSAFTDENRNTVISKLLYESKDKTKSGYHKKTLTINCKIYWENQMSLDNLLIMEVSPKLRKI